MRGNNSDPKALEKQSDAELFIATVIAHLLRYSLRASLH